MYVFKRILNEGGVGREGCIVPFVAVDTLRNHRAVLQRADVTQVLLSQLTFKAIEVRIERIVVGHLMFYKLGDAVVDAV